MFYKYVDNKTNKKGEDKMSFLNLRGEMLHCSECKKSLAIEYKEVRRVQIGDLSVMEQIALNEEKMPKDYNAERFGYYFHYEVICNDCVPKSDTVLKVDEENILSPILDKYKYFFSEHDKIIEKFVKHELASMDADYIKGLISSAILECKRKNETKHELIKKRENAIMKIIIKRIFEKLHSIEEIRIWNEKCNQLLCELKEKAKLFSGFDLYFMIDSKTPRNLNPYIIYEATIAEPIPLENKTGFYLKTANFAEKTYKDIINEVEQVKKSREYDVKILVEEQLKNFNNFLKIKRLNKSLLIVDWKSKFFFLK